MGAWARALLWQMLPPPALALPTSSSPRRIAAATTDRERAAGLYAAWLYPLSCYIADLPVQCAIALVSLPVF